MKLLNTFFVAAVAGLALCLAQAGYAQPPTTIQQIHPQSPVGLSPWHTTNHVPPQGWLLGVVYERMLGSSSWFPFTPYTGTTPIAWYGFCADGNQINFQGSGTTFNGHILYPTNALQSGTIYWLAAELDGAVYWGREAADATTLPSFVEIWTYSPSRQCPASCLRLQGGPAFNAVFNGKSYSFGDRSNIFLPAPSSIRTIYANLDVCYITSNSFASKQVSVRAAKKTNPTTGNAVFHIDRKSRPSEPGFYAIFGGCFHPIPHCVRSNPCATSTCSCTSGCGESCHQCNVYVLGNLPTATVRLTVRRPGTNLPLGNAEVVLIDEAQTSFLSMPGLRTNTSGEITFSVPVDRRKTNNSYRFVVLDSARVHTSGPIAPPPANSTHMHLYSMNIPLNVPLTSPSPLDGSYHVTGSTMQFRWSAASGVTNYILWLKQGTGSWTGYPLGNTLGANYGNIANGIWEWDVEGRNSAGVSIASSETRIFHVNALGRPFSTPLDLMQIDGISDEELFDGLLGDSNGSTATTVAGHGFSIVQDEDGNILLPISESRSQDVDLKKVTGDGVETVVLIESTVERTREDAEYYEMKMDDPWKNTPFDPAEADSDWEDFLFQLFLTPEEAMFYDMMMNWGGGGWGETIPDHHECDGNCAH